MTQGVIVEFPPELAPSKRSSIPPSSPPPRPSASRSSVLASVVPLLRWRDGDEVHKAPLLTLNLTSTFFLNSYVMDDVTDQPLYTIRTSGPTTIIKRADPWDGDTRTAEIRWPMTAPTKGKNVGDGVSIQMRGLRLASSESLLRRVTLGGHRKFRIPNYSQSLKWKCMGHAFWCTTDAVKGPIAIFQPAEDSLPPRFEIFETLHDRDDARPMLVHHGVSTLLLDYLLVTALFLVSKPLDWMHARQFQDLVHLPQMNSLPDLTAGAVPRTIQSNTATSDSQWRKIMHGEPMFRKHSARSSVTSAHTASDSHVPSAEQLAKIVYGEPLFPKIRSSSPTPSSSGSDQEGTSDYVLFSSPIRQRPHSPASESIFYPLSRGPAPSHTYLDPSYYSKDDIPPVPPIPARFSVSESSRSPRSRSSSSQSNSSMNTRRLPEIPVPPIPPFIPRPRSTPPQSIISPTEAGGSSPPPLPVPLSARRPTRQLPQIPLSTSVELDQRASPGHTSNLGYTRARSQSQSHVDIRMHDKLHRQMARMPRTLPSPPTSSSQADTSPYPMQRAVSDRGLYTTKEVDDDLAWMHGTVPHAAYDIPPPAYSSINFSPPLPNVPGPPSPSR